MIVIVFTGGTISMRRDPATGGAVPTMGGSQLLGLVPGIDGIAEVEIDEWATVPAGHLTVAQLWALRARLAEHLGRPDVDGVVVTHGTDTLEESAYLAARSLPREKPLVFTGAMRTADDLSWDGPANLTDAVRVAASPEARDYGVLVVFDGRIFTASDVTKVETQHLDAFGSPGLGPIGIVLGQTVEFSRTLRPPRRLLAPEQLAEPVDIVYLYAGGDGRLVDAARATAVGLVVATLGCGNTNPPFFDAIVRCLESGKPVVVTSRVPRGRVAPVYGFRGGGRDLRDAGAIFGGARRPTQVRIDLMLGLGAQLSGSALASLFAE